MSDIQGLPTMLRIILSFFGLIASPAPAAPPARPPSRRSDKPVGRRPTVRDPGVSPERAAAFLQEQAARDARNAAVIAEQQSAAEDVRFADAVRLIGRAHNRSSGLHIDPRSVTAAEAIVGGPTAEYMRACRYAGVSLPLVGDGMTPVRLAALRTELLSRTTTDLDSWEKGDIAVTKARTEAKRHGEPVPPALEMPAEVVAGLAKLARERIERLARRTGGKASTGTETATNAATDSSVTTPVTSTTAEAKDGDVETYSPPGPK